MIILFYFRVRSPWYKYQNGICWNPSSLNWRLHPSIHKWWDWPSMKFRILFITCIICYYTIQASRMGDSHHDWVIPRCNFILDDRARVFNGVIARSKVDDHDAWCALCARKHLCSECVRCQETHQVKTAWKERKVYGIKIVRIFLGSYRIPNMV